MLWTSIYFKLTIYDIDLLNIQVRHLASVTITPLHVYILLNIFFLFRGCRKKVCLACTMLPVIYEGK